MAIPSMLAKASDYLTWWQAPLLLLLIAVVVFWAWYRRKQM